jgi:hypothetical protein
MCFQQHLASEDLSLLVKKKNGFMQIMSLLFSASLCPATTRLPLLLFISPLLLNDEENSSINTTYNYDIVEY